MTPADTWDALVIGAGPAGSLTARQVALLGRRVLLVDRAQFPRAKVCGCCLNPAGLRVLHEVGLGDLTSEQGAVPLEAIDLRCGSVGARLPIAGVALSRERFDAALLDAAQRAGVTFLPGTTASLGNLTPEFREIHLRELDQTLQARAVVVADGLGSPTLSRQGQPSPPAQHARIGAGVILPEHPAFAAGTIFMACGRTGYLGGVRLEDGRLDLACALDADAVAQAHGIGPVTADLLTQAGWPVPPGLVEAAWKGTPRLTRSPGRLGDERLFAVGDAAGYVEPFTGEGMSWALAGAQALAPLVATACQKWEPALLTRWEAEHRRLVQSRQSLCRWLAWTLRRPWLLSGLLHLLRRWPGLARPVLRSLHPVPQEVT